MALSITTVNTTTVVDSTQNINLQQSKTVSDTTSNLNVVVQTYNMTGGSGAVFIDMSKGDIDSIQDITIFVTHKPTVYAGIDVGFGSTTPASAAFAMTDSFTLTGALADKVWLRNLNDDPVTVLVILGGTNAS